MFGLTFETTIKGGIVFGELTYRPNQPLQFNAADLLGAVLSPVAPTTLREQERALPPGGTLAGFERHKQVQLQLGAVGQVPAVLGAAGLDWGAEIIYKAVPDLPDPAVTRFGASDVFGQGPVNGVCPPPAAPSQCTTDGYVSSHAFGYRPGRRPALCQRVRGGRPDPGAPVRPGRFGLVGRRRHPGGPQTRHRFAAP